ncbi:rRNA adenine N-6-methyltransferase family protein [Streptomyces sp. NPDC057654]|uniref:rRNA adenine N-6-methyltransferase family protein n=1 Tax=Streptomyces sp. NPDC057654 TaxID=3346196 RepID=UPI0036C4DA44
MTMKAGDLRARCAADIEARLDGAYFTGQPWLRATFLTVPREEFVPGRVWWAHPRTDGLYHVIDRAERPRAWLKAVYMPLAALITQIADGRVRTEDGPTDCSAFTSSISCPAVVVDMLHHLDLQPSNRVLEIGTGSGYNTALLAQQTDEVTSVEIDRGLAKGAAATLHQLGYAPLVVCADGEQGYAARAPYDRILSTAAVRAIPPAWPRQTRAGGVIVTPLATPFNCDVLCRLVSDGQGGATGTLIKSILFMKTRDQRTERPFAELGWTPTAAAVDLRRTWADYEVTISASGEQHVRLRSEVEVVSTTSSLGYAGR